MNIWLCIYLIVFIVHNMIFFNLVNQMLVLKKGYKALRIITILNSLMWIMLEILIGIHNPIAYLFLFIIYIIEVIYLYEVTLIPALVAGLTLPIHVFALKLILIGTVSLISDWSIYFILTHDYLDIIIMIVVSLMLSLSTYTLIVLTKDSDALVMTTEKTRLHLFIAMEFINIILILSTSLTNSSNIEVKIFSAQQLMMGVTALANLYIGMGIMMEMASVTEAYASKEQDLIIKAERDPLVGAYNKAVTEQLIDEHLKQYNQGVLIMIDIDNFKAINDTFGHAYGDKVLIEVHDILKEAATAEDIIGRVGGDEFMIFHKLPAPIDDIIEQVTTLCGLLQKTYVVKGLASIDISASIGIVIATDQEQYNFNTLYQKADQAMYITKQNNKNGFTVYNLLDQLDITKNL
ncbi:MAG: hypothetical protein BEN19_00645 [Epulopiscium sp. Nuni2H_MBin003]|nr:MAG: hypothetical protein BEN19_00645 [Epulopiscium sp. Nuni2H_MBin003]